MTAVPHPHDDPECASDEVHEHPQIAGEILCWDCSKCECGRPVLDCLKWEDPKQACGDR